MKDVKNIFKVYLMFRILVEATAIILVALATGLLLWFMSQLSIMFL